MKYKGLILICVIICLFSIASVTAGDVGSAVIQAGNGTTDDAVASSQENDLGIDISEENDNLETNSNDLLNDGESKYVDGNTFDDIQRALNSASDRDKIYLNNSLFTGNGKAINVNKSISIYGNGATLDAQKKSSIFNVTANNVTLTNIIFTNANSTNNLIGGAIEWTGNEGNISNSRFVNNTAINGAGILFLGSNVTLDHCDFITNFAEYNGAALFGYGTNIIASNCNFINNKAERGGGAILWSTDRIGIDNVNIFDCNFTGNHAAQGGGAIQIYYASTYISGCEFENNTAPNGGAIQFLQYGSVELTKSRFINNTADYNGGAVFINGNELSITDSEFIHNTASMYAGGAVYVYNSANINFSNLNFTDNFANTSGGAIIWDCDDGKINQSNFINNSAKQNGGAIYLQESKNCNLTDSTFIYNDASTGGAIYWDIDNGTISNSTFISNSAEYNGGAVHWTGTEGTIADSKFDNNVAGYNGGAVFWYEDGSYIVNSEFINNTALAHAGGALYLYSRTYGDISKSTFIGNSAKTEGGAVFWYCGEGEIVYSDFTNNKAMYAGAVFCYAEQPTLIFNSTFTNNNASIDGGALYWYGKNSKVKSSQFTGNIAGNNGGAIILNDTGTFEDVNFTENKAKSGAGIYTSANLTIAVSTFKNNSAEDTSNNIATTNNANVTSSNIVSDSPLVKKEITLKSEANNIVYGNTVYIEVNVTSNGQPLNKGRVFAIINNTEYFADVKNGNATIAISGLNAGTYDVDVSYTGDEDSAKPHYSVEFIVSKIPASIEWVNATGCIYGESIKITASIKSGDSPINEGKMSVIINNRVYSANVNNGTATIDIPDLNAGKYAANLTYDGNYYADNATVEFEVSKQNATITANDIAYVINYGGSYSIILKDANGKAVNGEKVTFTLNGKNIGSATTNSNGVATIQITPAILKVAKSGSKNLIVSLDSQNYNPVSKTVKATINKEKTKILKAKKTYKFKRSKKAKNIKVTLKDSKNKVLKNVKVTIKLSGKKIKGKKVVVGKTNKKGIVTFKLGKKLTKKTKVKYTMTYKGSDYYNKATKKGKIVIK